MFTQIGNILPRLLDYENLFGSHARLALAISATYVDILEFCVDAKSVFRASKRPSSKKVARLPCQERGLLSCYSRALVINLLVFSKSTWKPFKDRFNKTLDSFKEHRKQVEKESSIAHMIEDKRAQELAHDARLKAEREKKGNQRIIIMIAGLISSEIERLKLLAMLSTINYKQRQRRLHQLRHPGTCDWLLKLPEYQRWRASTSSTCLHCHGIRK